MKLTDIPSNIPEAWAQNGLRNVIPTTTTTTGAASLDKGFPAVTMIPLTEGGIPPSGRDMNGALFLVSGWSRWLNAGGPVPFNSDLSAAIGGYPKGAVLASATTVGALWISSIDDNTSDPDTGGANWIVGGYLTLSLLTSLVQGLPTSLPSSSGQLWNNGGTLCIS